MNSLTKKGVDKHFVTVEMADLLRAMVGRSDARWEKWNLIVEGYVELECLVNFPDGNVSIIFDGFS